MGEIRRGFTREFKVEAVRQVVEGERTVAEVARDLEISRNVLYRWKRQVTAETDAAFPGNGRRPRRIGCGSVISPTSPRVMAGCIWPWCWTSTRGGSSAGLPTRT